MAGEERTLAAAVGVLPTECYENPTWKGMAWFARDVAIYAAAVTALVIVDSPVLLPPLWILAGLAISALFIIGHDAAHGALFKSKRLNYVVGQLAMLPALHLYEGWVFGHNRIHHGHTTRRGMDYVWHPLTPEEFASLSRLGKLAHRFKWSCLGAGIYYLHEIWWDKMVWNFAPPAKLEREVRRDRIAVGSYAALASAALLVGGLWTSASPSGALWMWLKVFGVPFLIWNYSIGITVYVHHICRDIPWHQRRDWNKFAGQVRGTTVIRIPAWLNVFFHNIFLHVAHHVDMRIPFYALPRATHALQAHFSDSIVERGYGPSDYLETTRTCKLFDFEHSQWLSYEERPPQLGAAAG